MRGAPSLESPEEGCRGRCRPRNVTSGLVERLETECVQAKTILEFLDQLLTIGAPDIHIDHRFCGAARLWP